MNAAQHKIGTRRLRGLATLMRKPLLFNGREPQVGQLYAGTDLKKTC